MDTAPNGPQFWQLETYANKQFLLVKKGAFGNKKLSVRELLAWQKGALKNPLLKIVTKDAAKIFLLIQSYMGDRPHKEKDEAILAKQIVDFVITDPKAEHRDEIFCQLCKQLTTPPTGTNLKKGWELFCVCIQYFPPSADLEPHLAAWLKQNQEHTAGATDYCKYALRKLPKMMAEGARGRLPSLPELKALVSAPFKQAIFGSTLEEVMEIQKVTDTEAEIPLVLSVLCQAVLDLKGHETEGIFRVPGDTGQVTNLKIEIENGVYTCQGLDDPHVPGSLLKLWMRELCEPIIPTSLYDDAIEAAKNEDTEKAVSLIARIPPLNQKVVKFVVEYLRHVAQPENVPKTKMNINNLAMVFAPNFLRCPSEDPSVIFNTQKYQQTYVKQLITDLKAEHIPASSGKMRREFIEKVGSSEYLIKSNSVTPRLEAPRVEVSEVDKKEPSGVDIKKSASDASTSGSSRKSSSHNRIKSTDHVRTKSSGSDHLDKKPVKRTSGRDIKTPPLTPKSERKEKDHSAESSE